MLARAWMKRALTIFICLAIGVIGVAWLRPADVAGVRAPDNPLQVMIDGNAPEFSRAGWRIRPLATYDITARLLHKKRYYAIDSADLVPYDFAVGWGPMSDSAVLGKLTITQGNRFFFWQYHGAPPIPEDQIISHAANMHLIPSNGAVRRALWWASPGDIVHMTGYLVEAHSQAGGVWRSSLSRTDTGNGACELMWVESCEFLQGNPGVK